MSACRFALAITASAAACVLAAQFITLEESIEVLGLVVHLRDVELLVLILLGSLLMLPFVGAGRGTTLRHGIRYLARHLREAPLRKQVGALLASTFLICQFVELLELPVQGLRWKMQAAKSSTPSITFVSSSAHVPHLVERVVTREASAPAVVYIDDEDPRAHQASYYAYPRLLMMAPRQRSWSARSRQLYHAVADDAFADPGPAPAAEVSAGFARDRGLDFFVVNAEGIGPETPLRWLRTSSRPDPTP